MKPTGGDTHIYIYYRERERRESVRETDYVTNSSSHKQSLATGSIHDSASLGWLGLCAFIITFLVSNSCS